MTDITRHNCSICNTGGVKLYCPYGEFLRPERIRCRAHIPPNEQDWYIPLIEDDDGSVWGYTSAPDEHITRWEALPDG
jgi:hypothetical protein